MHVLTNNQYSIQRGRELYIDLLKGIGILLVVLGHVVIPSGLSAKIIFSFHMPLFFMISGYLFNYEKWSGNYIGFCKKNFVRLILPYMFCCILFFVLWLTFSVPKPFVQTPFSAMYGIFKNAGLGWVYGIGNHNIYSALSFEPVGPMWFLPCCFLGLIILHPWIKLFNKNIKTAIIGVIFLIPFVWFGQYISKYIYLPWSFDITLIALIFFYAGYLIKRYNIVNALSHKVWLLLLLFGIWFVALKFSKISMNSRVYDNLWLAVVGAICMSLIIMTLLYKYHTVLFENKIGRVIGFCGVNTMVILCFHNRLIDYTANTSWLFYNPIITTCYLVIACVFIKFITDHIPKIKKLF